MRFIWSRCWDHFRGSLGYVVVGHPRRRGKNLLNIGQKEAYIAEHLLTQTKTANKGIYRHDAEGSDDMPVRHTFSSVSPSKAQMPSRQTDLNSLQAHIKSSMIGASVSIPISNGRLATGTWQGIWFLEFRNGKQRRKILATIQGEKM